MTIKEKKFRNKSLLDIQSEESFESMLINGNILKRLHIDCPDIQLLDIGEYIDYVEKYWSEYSSCVFAKLGNYKLELISIGVLDFCSISNKMNEYYRINNNIGFRMINMKTEKILKVESYSDIKHILSQKE